MHLSEFVLLVVATIAAIAAGVAMVAANFRAARNFVYLGALTFGSMGVVWSQQAHGYSFAMQATVAAVVAAIGAVGLVWGLNEIRGRALAAGGHEVSDKSPPKKPESAPPPAAQAPVDNRGGIIIQGPNSGNPTVNNFGPPPPTMRVVDDQPMKKVDGDRYYKRVGFEIVGNYVPPRLVITAQGNNLITLDIEFEGMTQRRQGTKDGTHFIVITSPPLGLYYVSTLQSDSSLIPVNLALQ